VAWLDAGCPVRLDRVHPSPSGGLLIGHDERSTEYMSGRWSGPPRILLIAPALEEAFLPHRRQRIRGVGARPR